MLVDYALHSQQIHFSLAWPILPETPAIGLMIG